MMGTKLVWFYVVVDDDQINLERTLQAFKGVGRVGVIDAISVTPDTEGPLIADARKKGVEERDAEQRYRSTIRRGIIDEIIQGLGGMRRGDYDRF
jgi:hypothetical protein